MEYRGSDIDYSGVDYLTIWIGQRAGAHSHCTAPPCFNPFWHGEMLSLAKKKGLGVVFYAYVIAFLAKHGAGLNDCDVGGVASLCQKGADFIRSHEVEILRTYSSFARETAARLGAEAEVLFLMEPDFHQYHESTQEGAGPLAHSEMVELFSRLSQAVRQHLPFAKISLDVSPWVNNQEEWLQPFLLGSAFDFLHTAGGRTTADSTRIRADDPSNMVTWRQVSQATGKGIIADTGYSVGGATQGLDVRWMNAENVRHRIYDGVIGITQANPGSGWGRGLDSLRAELPPPLVCGA